jgi:hypothetical protein
LCDEVAQEGTGVGISVHNPSAVGELKDRCPTSTSWKCAKVGSWRDVAAEAAIGYGREGDLNLGRLMRIKIATAFSAAIRQ